MPEHTRKTPISAARNPQFDLLMNRTGVGFYYVNFAGDFEYANDAFAHQMGYGSSEEFMAARPNSMDFYVDPAEREMIRAAADAGEDVTDGLVELKRIDGSTFTARITSERLFNDEEEQVGYSGTIIDISDLSKAQKELTAAEESYYRIFERATEGIYRSSLDGQMIRSNPALYKLNGFDSEEEHLAAVHDIAREWYVDPNRRKEFKDHLFEHGSIQNFESEIICYGTGDQIWISENAYLVRSDNGKPLFYEGTVRDITEQKRAEIEMRTALAHAEKANRIKSDFLAQMSHELRTPLNAIIGFSDLLLTRATLIEPMKIKEYANDINKSGIYLLDLISDLLDLSKIERGGSKLELETISANAIINEAMVVMRALADQRDQSFSFACGSVTFVTADKRSLHQCLLNLMSNAVKFSPDGACIEISAKAKHKGMVRIAVANPGEGMDPDLIARIGEPFVTVGSTRETPKHGSGLGLAITKGLVEAMNGRFAIESKRGQGTTASILLPAAS